LISFDKGGSALVKSASGTIGGSGACCAETGAVGGATGGSACCIPAAATAKIPLENPDTLND